MKGQFSLLFTIILCLLSLSDFLDKVDYIRLSVSNYEIGEYPRAIMYLEDVISKTGNLSDHLPLLSKAYALYGDLDSVAGASTFQNSAPKMEDLLLSHRVSGQLEVYTEITIFTTKTLLFFYLFIIL